MRCVVDHLVVQASAEQDRAAAFTTPTGRVGVVADGAGGTSGGADAADTVIDAVRLAAAHVTPEHAPDWRDVLTSTDRRLVERLAGTGQAAAAIAEVDGPRVRVAVVGDVGIWRVTSSVTARLAQGRPKPLLGAGGVRPTTADYQPAAGESLLLASDGLWKYAPHDQLLQALATGDPLSTVIDLARLPSGTLRDDAAALRFRFMP